MASAISPTRGAGFDGGDDRRHEVGAVARAPATTASSAARHRDRAAAGAHRAHALDLLALDVRVDAEDVSIAGAGLASANLLTPTTTASPASMRQLRAVGRFLDLALDEPGFDRRQRAARAIDPRRAAPRRSRSISFGQRLDRVRAADRIDRVRDAAFAQR